MRAVIKKIQKAVLNYKKLQTNIVKIFKKILFIMTQFYGKKENIFKNVYDFLNNNEHFPLNITWFTREIGFHSKLEYFTLEHYDVFIKL